MSEISINFLMDERNGIELIVCNHSMLSYPVHNRVSVYTIGLITDGAVNVIINNDLQRCQKGDFFVIPPYLSHSIQAQLQNRIRKAQRLLHQTDKITEVALDTGFCDQSHFIKQFKKIVRLTPSKYIIACNMLETHTD